MSTASAEHPTPDELLPPGHNVITEANWEEMKAKGFRMVIEQVDLDTPDGQQSLKLWQDTYGREHIYTGSAFEWDERRPLDNKPGSGIYNTVEGEQVYIDEGPADERQPSSDTGPASN